MNWYAIQVKTGKENEVSTALKDFGLSVIEPYTSIFFKRGGNISLVKKPLMPGYVIASFEYTDFYIYKQRLRIERMMQRLCGNGFDPVPLNDEDLEFIKRCSYNMEPLILKKRESKPGIKNLYDIINSPPWAQYAYIEFFDISKFSVKLHITTNGAMKDHAFRIAAYSIDYTGQYAQQLQDLSFCKFG